jgi:hypothetical protein
MKRTLTCMLIIAAASALALDARAQCTSSADCKGGRICQDGRCMSPVSTCSKDTDCPGSLVCQAGACVETSLSAPPAPRLATATTLAPVQPAPVAVTRAARAPREALGAVHANVLGLLGVGFMPGAELGYKSIGVLARLRFPQLGVASHFLYPDADEDESLAFSIGLSLGARWYTSKLRGFYVGGLLEYSFIQVQDDPEQKMEVSHRFATGVDIGYRWHFDRFLLGIGAILGADIPFEAENQFYNGFNKPRDEDVTFFGAAVLELGFYFLR